MALKSKCNIAGYLFHSIFIMFSFLCILPIIAIVSISLSKETDIVLYGYSLVPKIISYEAYKYIFMSPEELLDAYSASILIIILGGTLSLLVITLFAYPLSRPDFIFRSKLSLFVFVTMVFNGGLVPTYVVVSRFLHLSDTIWAMIVPLLANAFFIIIMRTYFSTIPLSVVESARIDGANELKTFFRIVLPLSKPALATVGLFIALNYWNDWFNALLYISPSKKHLVPLQYMLYKIMSNISFISQMQGVYVNISPKDIPVESARMAMCILAAGPMMFIFPFFQKYFVKGLTVGSVRG